MTPSQGNSWDNYQHTNNHPKGGFYTLNLVPASRCNQKHSNNWRLLWLCFLCKHFLPFGKM